MNTVFIATFHTHLSALITSRTLASRGVANRMMPVPRRLSSSCGTCVRYETADAQLDAMDTDVERVYRTDGEEYFLLHENR